MFGAFVVGTLFITKWAAAKTKSAADFSTAGGGITGFQNGLAIRGRHQDTVPRLIQYLRGLAESTATSTSKGPTP